MRTGSGRERERSSSLPIRSLRRPDPESRRVNTGRLGFVTRVAATAAIVVGTLYGTVWGSDQDFPIGPFRMYTDAAGLNTPTPDTRVHARNTAGEDFILTQGLIGVRRAEIEGQLDRFRADPSRLRYLAEIYEHRYPQRPRIVSVRIVVDWIELKDGEPTGDVSTERIVSWH